MRKIILLLSLTYSLSLFSNLPDGSQAQNFTFIDEQGNSQKLYEDYLNKGISVILEITTSDCEPCWNFHQSGQIQDIYKHFGPNGTILSNVVTPILIESNPKTTRACFMGGDQCGEQGRSGDWTQGVNYPIYNPTANLAAKLVDDYDITEYPIIYVISPSGYIKSFKGTATTYEEVTSYAVNSFQMHNSTFTVTGGDCEPLLIDLHPSQGEGTVRYAWSNGSTSQDISVMESGEYFVTMTDENAYSVTIGPIEVNVLSELSVATTKLINATCYGASDGTISINVSGGSNTFSFNWNNGANQSTLNNLQAGYYDVTITDLMTNCISVQSFNITQPENIQSDIDVEHIACKGSFGSVEIETTGGQEPYRYVVDGVNYNASSFILTEGVHTISIIDANNCTEVQSIELRTQVQPVALAGVQGIISCNSTSVQLSAAGSSEGQAFSYLWLDNQGIEVGSHRDIIVTRAGEYTLIVSHQDSDCTASKTVLVSSDNAVPLVNINSSGNIDCHNSMIELSGQGSSQGPNFQYQWSSIDGEIISSADQINISVSTAGRYQLEVTNLISGCSASSEIIVFEEDSPHLELSGNTVFCENSSSELCLSLQDNLRIQWILGNEIISTEPCIIVSSSSEYNVVLTNTLTGCTTSEMIEVSTTNLPDTGISGSLDFCAGEETILCYDQQTDITKSWFANGQVLSTHPCITISNPTHIELVAENQITGCTNAEAYQITEFSSPQIVVAPIQNINCENPKTIISISSDNQLNEIRWTDSSGTLIGQGQDIEVSKAGLYNVEVENMVGCISNHVISVFADIELPLVNIPQPQDINCAHHLSTLIADVDTDDWNIEWLDESENVIGAGREVEVSEAGIYYALISKGSDCILYYEVIVEEDDDLPELGQIQTLITDCEIGQLRLQPSNDELNSYRWTNHIGVTISTNNYLDLTEPGTYLLYGSNSHGCTTVKRIEIDANQFGIPSSAFEVVQNTLEVSFINLTNGISHSYEWQFGDGSFSTEEHPIYTYSEPGTYLVTLLTNHSCGTSDKSISLDISLDGQTTSVQTLEGVQEFTIHPNPANSLVNIDARLDINEDVTITITNALGENIFTDQLQQQIIKLDYKTSGLSAGIYSVQLSTSKGTISRQLVITR